MRSPGEGEMPEFPEGLHFSQVMVFQCVTVGTGVG